MQAACYLARCCLAHVLPRHVQQLGAWRRELSEYRASSALVTDAPDSFSERLRAFAQALAVLDLSVLEAAVMAAGWFQLLSMDAQTLKHKLEALQRFFHPYGNAPADWLPATLGHRDPAGTTRLQAALLSAPFIVAYTADGLREYIRNLVALGGLFESEGEAREACMRSPRLVRGHSWGRLVRLKAAVLAGGGALADVQTALQSSFSAQDVLSAHLLQGRGCGSGSTSLHLG
jgi:hypothetical protein